MAMAGKLRLYVTVSYRKLAFCQLGGPAEATLLCRQFCATESAQIQIFNLAHQQQQQQIASLRWSGHKQAKPTRKQVADFNENDKPRSCWLAAVAIAVGKAKIVQRRKDHILFVSICNQQKLQYFHSDQLNLIFLQEETISISKLPNI